MSDLTHTIGTVTQERPPEPRAAEELRGRNRRRAASLASAALLAWAIVELGSLALRHTVGSEVYGVLVAAVAVAAAIGNLVLLASPRKRTLAVAGAIALWAVVALGGVAGVVAHVVGPVPGHGEIDTRSRPTLAPLAFTAMGAAGALAVVIGYRAGTARLRTGEEER